MRCERFRIAISASLDGEEPGINPELLTDHLLDCPDCRAWRTAARAVTVTVPTPPDLTAAILAADRPAPRSPAGVLRWALAISAVAQLLLALPALMADPGSADAALHTGREMASFDVAVAIGFLFVAWRPARARALVPVAVVLSGCLLLTSAVDVADGAAHLGHEMNHLLAGVQAALLWWLSREEKTPGGLASRPEESVA